MKKLIVILTSICLLIVMVTTSQAQSVTNKQERMVFDGPEAQVVKVDSAVEAPRVVFSGPEVTVVTQKKEANSSVKRPEIVFEGAEAQVIRVKSDSDR